MSKNANMYTVTMTNGDKFYCTQYCVDQIIKLSDDNIFDILSINDLNEAFINTKYISSIEYVEEEKS